MALQIHEGELGICLVRGHNKLHGHLFSRLHELERHLWCDVNGHREEFVGHDLVALTQEFFRLASALVAHFLSFVFGVALHLQTSSVENQNWCNIERDQHLQLLLAVLDQLLSASAVDELHSAVVGALVQPAVAIDSDSLAAISSDILWLSD